VIEQGGRQRLGGSRVCAPGKATRSEKSNPQIQQTLTNGVDLKD
jgi:hypothetical protein